MHNVLLTTQVPATRHTQLLHVFSGLAAHKPVPLCELHIVCRPGNARSDSRSNAGAGRETARPSAPSFRSSDQVVGGTQDIAAQKNRKIESGAGEAKFVRVIASVVPRSLTESANGEYDGDDQNDDFNDEHFERRDNRGGSNIIWELRQDETPDAVKRPVIARVSERSRISLGKDPANKNSAAAREQGVNEEDSSMDADTESSEPARVAKELEDWLKQHDYSPVTCYFLLGHRWTYFPRINLSFFQIRFAPSDSLTATTISPHTISLLPTLVPSLIALPTGSDALKPVDPSGSYIVEASALIRDADRKPELMQEGVKELTALRDRLKGCVELHTLERLPAMDVRVR